MRGSSKSILNKINENLDYTKVGALSKQYKENKSSLTFKPLDPKKNFNFQMRLLRKSYLDEANRKKLSEKQTLKSYNEKLKNENNILNEDIVKFRESAGLNIQPAGSKSNSSKTIHNNATSRKKTTESEIFRNKIKQARLLNNLKFSKKLSDKREAQLLSLYYSSKDFVTYKNLEKKIEQCFLHSYVAMSNPIASLNVDVAFSDQPQGLEIERSARIKEVLTSDVTSDRSPDLSVLNEVLRENVKKKI
ncbi:hypothetical protein HK099_005059 [Clydaea vesicula]|uniref:Uncharacterized protein n=1 Tax=Clydaea vesicula TaxID=447962 RepID=A0AAD5UAF0_9FUNG|nr:hypothetical protein HK099_005059 [Clydaea vesicula]